MSEEVVEIPTWWAQVIPAGKTETLNFPEECILEITNISFPEHKDEKQQPCRIIAHVDTINPDDIKDDVKTTTAQIQTTSLLATLIPQEIEHQKTHFVFSALNTVRVENQGPIDVHLCGFLEQIEADDEEEDDDDEAIGQDEEEEQPDIKQKMMELSAKKKKQ